MAGGGITLVRNENFSYKYSNPYTYPVEYNYFWDHRTNFRNLYYHKYLIRKASTNPLIDF